MTEARVFHSVFGNVKLQVAGLGKGLRDMRDGDKERLEGGSHGGGYSPQWFLYFLSTARALSKFGSDFQIYLVSE